MHYGCLFDVAAVGTNVPISSSFVHFHLAACYCFFYALTLASFCLIMSFVAVCFFFSLHLNEISEPNRAHIVWPGKQFFPEFVEHPNLLIFLNFKTKTAFRFVYIFKVHEIFVAILLITSICLRIVLNIKKYRRDCLKRNSYVISSN